MYVSPVLLSLCAALALGLVDAGGIGNLDCSDDLCENGSNCVDFPEGAGYCCICKTHYSGKNCEDSPPGGSFNSLEWVFGGIDQCISCTFSVDIGLDLDPADGAATTDSTGTRRKRGGSDECAGLPFDPANQTGGNSETGGRKKRGLIEFSCHEVLCETVKCFPSGSVVSVMDGDDRVFMFTHNDPHQMVKDYLTITTKRGRAITASKSHYIYIIYNGELVAMRADRIQVGDEVMTPQEGDAPGGYDRDVVTDISQNADTGAHNPHTLNGHIIVNGVLASSYTDAIPAQVSHYLLWMPRQIYHLLPLEWSKYQQHVIVDNVMDIGRIIFDNFLSH